MGQLQYWTEAMEKQVGDRLQIVMTDPLLLRAYQKFGGEPFRRSSVFHGLGRFLTEQQVRGEVCFEIGTWNGLTAVVLSQFFEQVVTVDIAHNVLRGRLLDYLGIRNVVCVDIKDNADKARVADRLDFDFAYLDGNHADDTESDWNLTKRCGRVLFHEVWPHQPPVWELVNTLPHREVTFGGAGLALWEAAT
jgi:hypothetical protein